MKKLLILLFFGLGIISCKDEVFFPDNPNLPLYKVGIINNQFIDSQGDTITPWGLNYTNPQNVGLIDDNWMDETVWETIQGDFDEMKALSANIVRIHLQYHRFMNDPTTANEEALQRLFELVKIAEEKELYLVITGLGSYRASDVPAWYNDMNDTERWATQREFWKNVAEKIGHRTSVFSYNLMNEPVVAVGCTTVNDCSWLPGSSLGGFNFVQNISRDPDNMFASTMVAWAGEMTAAIRGVDQNTLITTGFLSLGDVAQFDDNLDYVSTHIYPTSGQLDESVDFIQNNATAPLVIEETSNYNCNISELEQFLDQINGDFNGLMGHYHGKPLDELDENIIVDALRINFLNMFVNRNPND